MKKFLIAILMTMIFSMYAETYTVIKVSGRAQTTNGAISTGQELDGEQLVTIKGFNNYIKLDNNLYIYGPIINKKVKDAVEKPRLKKGKVVKASEIAPDVEGTRPGVATAASRASDAKEDFEWDE